MLDKAISRYLRARAVTSPWQIEGPGRNNFTAAIVIPALAEYENLPSTLDSLSLSPCELLAQTLVVIVINNRTDISSASRESNQQTLGWLKSHPCPQLNLAWVDACSPGLELPEREGVGLARKIGFDLCLERLDGLKNPLLISLDADTLVDENYLAAIFSHFQLTASGGAVLPFRHQAATDQSQERAIRSYELYLRSYLFGLQRAGSPYAYHSIGSAFACRADAYVKAGGMNRRQAAEDFYFLQQLAKTSGIAMLDGTVVRPAPRFSERVPFGTGQAVQEQVEQGTAPFRLIPATSFRLLKAWLELVADGWEASAAEICRQAEAISPVLGVFLGELNFLQVWNRLQKNHAASEQRLCAFHTWFDALRTRQLLTRAAVAGNASDEQLIEELLSWGRCPGAATGIAPLALLEKLQGVSSG